MILGQYQKMAKAHKDEVIIEYQNKKLTYGELERLSDIVANYFRDTVSEENIVISLNDSIDFSAALIGIMKSEKRAVLLNPQLPLEIQNNILQRENYSVILNEKLYEHIKSSDNSSKSYSGKNLTMPFVIFTSGSTNVAKTVMVHINMMINYNDAFYKIIQKRGIKSMQLLCSQYYSFGLCNLLIGLSHGIKIQVPDEKQKKNIFANLADIKKQNLDMMIWPASYLKTISSAQKLIELIPDNIKLIVTGGETLAIGQALIKKLKLEGISLFNSYGSSETLGIFNYDVEYDDFREEKNLIPIGEPIENIHYAIEDGELYLTFDFENGLVTQGERYQTGDLASLINGKLYLTGRADHCRKIRGYRVDMDSVERTIFNKMPVDACCVLCVKNAQEIEELELAYVASKEIREEDFRERLTGVLSDYMLPVRYHRLDKIPVNSNGKIDKKVIEMQIHGGKGNE